MQISTKLKVMNDAHVGVDSVDASTSCVSSIEIKVPVKVPAGLPEGYTAEITVELHRGQLREFLARTEPAFETTERYSALKPI